MSMQIWSNAFTFYNVQKLKQLSLLTIREAMNMLPLIIGATIMTMINTFFINKWYVDVAILAIVLFFGVLTTRSSAGLKNAGYFFRFSWLFLIALLITGISYYVSFYASLLGSFILLIGIFVLLRMADVCFKSSICKDDFLTPFTSLAILFRGLPLVVVPFILFAVYQYSAQYILYFEFLTPLLLCLLIIWCTNWYIIALYEQR